VQEYITQFLEFDSGFKKKHIWDEFGKSKPLSPCAGRGVGVRGVGD
jgi:hypothetical protein